MKEVNLQVGTDKKGELHVVVILIDKKIKCAMTSENAIQVANALIQAANEVKLENIKNGKNN